MYRDNSSDSKKWIHAISIKIYRLGTIIKHSIGNYKHQCPRK